MIEDDSSEWLVSLLFSAATLCCQDLVACGTFINILAYLVDFGNMKKSSDVFITIFVYDVIIWTYINKGRRVSLI